MGSDELYRMAQATSADPDMLRRLGQPTDPAVLVAMARRDVLAAYGATRERRSEAPRAAAPARLTG